MKTDFDFDKDGFKFDPYKKYCDQKDNLIKNIESFKASILAISILVVTFGTLIAYIFFLETVKNEIHMLGIGEVKIGIGSSTPFLSFKFPHPFV